MSWIDEFAKGSFSLYSGNTLSAFQPLDFFHFYPLWYDLWLARIVEAMKKLQVENKHYQDLKHALQTPSNMRAILQKLIPTYKGLTNKNIQHHKLVGDFFARMLEEACPADPFGKHTNQCHTAEEINDLYTTLTWQEADIPVARKIGQLLTAAGSLVHGQYNDVVTDMAWDTYGPYKITERGQDYTLLIRHFPNLAPKELWPQNFLASITDLKIFALYQNVEWEIACVGCHTIAKSGNPVEGLKKYAILADGKPLTMDQVNKIITELSQKAEAIYKQIRTLDMEQLKQLVMLQECYQLNKLFAAAKMDWRPTEEMTERIKNKPLLTGVVPLGTLMTDLEFYKKEFGLNKFAEEVLGEKV